MGTGINQGNSTCPHCFQACGNFFEKSQENGNGPRAKYYISDVRKRPQRSKKEKWNDASSSFPKIISNENEPLGICRPLSWPPELPLSNFLHQIANWHLSICCLVLQMGQYLLCFSSRLNGPQGQKS